ncbi:hypothetical protein HME9302_01299 [Alteripontixanthobacter maritimus]|uniref:Uncharacterized protein n=1 Tax=Alteripontixanthobacter maritimus TaxID=2161824 RepID=A0A369Q6S0_9SPHN|nr:hypothetical protein [Alteripontixanthobacter maritimus]RDC60100.1 hypothetical protein HME9302_01299 [Alteripontixanthobacter maritimus]
MKQWIWPGIAFAAFALLGYGARLAIGSVYGSGEARVLLETLSRSGLYLGSASATASATTLALMLTLIGMVRRADHDFDSHIYANIERIARLAVWSLLASLLLLLTFVFPTGEFDQLPERWYPILYEAIYAGTVVVVGLLAATVVMLYRTVRHVIAQITPGDEV